LKSLLRLRTFAHPYWKQVILALITVAFLTLISLVMPLIICQVIDQGLVEDNAQFVITASLILLVIGIARAFLIYWQRYLAQSIAARISYDLRNRLYNHIQRLQTHGF
jgi:ABC-type multidrug transport system fused ATPase/permease subunit